MDLSCLDGLVDLATDQDTRDDDVMYINDLPTLSFSENAYKVGNIVKGDVTLGSPIVTNLTMNTSNFTAGESIKSKAFPFCTDILSIDTVSQLTMTNDSVETCCEVPFYIKGAGQKFIDEQINLAKRIMINDIMGYFQGCLRVNEVVNNDVIGKFEDYTSQTVQAAANRYRGIQVTIDRYPYLEFYLEKIRLFFDTAITDTIRVYDLVENRHLTPISFTSVANQITDVTVNRTFETKKQRVNLFFYYDASLTGYYQSWLDGQRGCLSCGRYTPNGYSYFAGGDMAQGSITDGAIGNTGETYGISLTYSLNCTIAPFICSIRNLVQVPLFYKSASFIVNALARNPDKVNAYITLNRDNHTEVAEEYDNEYNVRMFGAFNENGKKIKQGLLDRIHLPKDICFGRKNIIKNKTIVP